MGGIEFLQEHWGIRKSEVIKKVLGDLPKCAPPKEKPNMPLDEEVKRWHRALALMPERSFPKDYLYRVRGLAPQILKDLNVGWFSGKISIPHYANGKLQNVKWRNLQGGSKYTSIKHADFNYLYPYDYFRMHFNNSKVLYLTEGEFDSMVLLQAGVPAMSLPSGVNDTMFRWVPLVRQFEVLCTLFDMDTPGVQATLRLSKEKGKVCKTFEEMIYPTQLVTWDWPLSFGKDITDARNNLVPLILEDYKCLSTAT
jgi:hypothetical protein